MKASFILLSILAATLTWWWHSRLAGGHHLAHRPRFLRRLAHSVIVGAAVYFGLMAVAMVWLLVTT